jgi:xanthosine phosphorylase
MSFHDNLIKSAEIIQQKVSDFVPKVGIVLGSGLGPLAARIENSTSIPYKDLPGFPISKVVGHAGALVLGNLGGVPVACLQGRVHLYEGTPPDHLKMIIRILKHLGCHTLVTTNAVGSLREEVVPGELVAISDHINFQGTNPLIGPNDEDFGPRFFAMDDAYDKKLRQKLHETADELGIAWHEGVYCAAMGPCFETPAEINAFRILGADTVGMSIVPEVLVARHCGLKVVAISAITNLAAGLSKVQLSHDQTLRGAKLAEEKLCKLIEAFLSKITE